MQFTSYINENCDSDYDRSWCDYDNLILIKSVCVQMADRAKSKFSF